MTKNPLIELEKLGQSIWLDNISRELIQSGKLLKLIKDDHLRGITSNPSIFEKAIGQTAFYDQQIKSLAERGIKDAKSVYESLAIKDIEEAADLLRPVYDATNGGDGFVSLEVSPHLAFDTAGSIAEAKRLWQAVNRPNLMIKIPGTKEGMPAISQLISEGINVNVTLLFSIESYREAALAYLSGLKQRLDKGQPIKSIASVASFFISRIDSKIDAALLSLINKANDKAQDKLASSLLGTVAIANAKLAYLLYEEIYQSDLAKELIRGGASPQRLLWASTSTKNKNYRDVLYVESLIGPHTVNTLPPATLDAFRDHGEAANTIKDDIFRASLIMTELGGLGIDFRQCCEELLKEGVKLFIDSFDQLLDAVKRKLTALNG
jgi:transaldolase/glucose-6-phosphate isomerase